MFYQSLASMSDEIVRAASLHKAISFAAQAILLASLWQAYKLLKQLKKNQVLSKKQKGNNSSPFLRKQQIARYSIQTKHTLEALRKVLTQESFVPAESQAILPAIQQLRARGEALSAQRKRLVLGTLKSVQSEINLRVLISELRQLERTLQRIPKSKLSLTDVLEGRFNGDYVSDVSRDLATGSELK